MKKEELLKQLEEKETLKNKLEIVYHQLCGQIALLRDLLSKIKNSEETKENETK